MGIRTTRCIRRNQVQINKPPVLHIPNSTGRFHLYSDTSKFATGSVLYQTQKGKPKLTAYASKRLPEVAARNRPVWFSYKYSQFFTLTKKSKF